MSQGNTIQASFGVDIAPLKRDMAEAERIGRQGADRVATAMNTAAAQANRRATGFGNANPAGFGVPFGMSRAQRNSSSGFAPARAGQYPAPDSGGAAGVGGAGFRGIGIVTAAYAIKRAVNFWEELVQAQVKISENIGKLSASQGGDRSTGSIHSNLSGIAEQMEELQTQSLRDSQTGSGGVATTPQARAFAALKRTVRQTLSGDSDQQEQSRMDTLHQKAIRDMSDLAGKQEDLNQIEDARLYGDEKSAKLLEEKIRNAEKLKEIEELSVRLGVESPSLVNAENVRHSQANEVIQRSENDVISRFNMRRNSAMAAQDEEQFNTFQAANGDWAGYKQEQRDHKHARAVFDARRADFESRRARGAYGQSGPDSEAFGMSDSMDGWDKVVAVMREVWGKN